MNSSAIGTDTPSRTEVSLLIDFALSCQAADQETPTNNATNTLTEATGQQLNFLNHGNFIAVGKLGAFETIAPDFMWQLRFFDNMKTALFKKSLFVG